ncbi:MAG: cysteine--tRNA ligase [Nanoarchaeota archaeon]|nr:cysteine--tRNA ligase [Nanoarchaeota archaeon]
MDLKFYNTLSRKKEVFQPIKKRDVGLYTCGPTVYNFAHIGNLRSYIFGDILKRTLHYNKFRVKHIMNITDVGHLTSDADTGEDKMLKGAKREKKTVYEIAEFYTKAFKEDLKSLNILPPDKWIKATDHIKDMIKLIQKLEKKGFTYNKGGNVYFDTSKFKTYGELAKLNLKSTTKSRVEKDINKKSPHDFVLWFTKSKFTEQEMKWPSSFGKGYPGWHIECSAMSIKYLGKQFDIHTGGIDHIQVHHTNEIAQSEAATGKKFVNYWLHNEFLILDKEKMAKSGSTILLKTLIDKNYDPLAYRYLCLTSHYKKPLTFSFESLDAASTALNNLKEKIKDLQQPSKPIKKESKLSKCIERFDFAVNDDLNTPEALAVVWDLLKDDSISNKEKHKTILNFDNILGLNLKEIKKEKINKKVKELIEEREQARKEKDFNKADVIRERLEKLGVILEDTKEGVKWRKKS